MLENKTEVIKVVSLVQIVGNPLPRSSHLISCSFFENVIKRVSVTQSASRLTGCGSISAGSGNILLWRLTIKYFLHSFPSADLRRPVVSFLQKNVHKYCLTAYRTKPTQEACG